MAKLKRQVEKRYGSEALEAVVEGLRSMRFQNASGQWGLTMGAGDLGWYDVDPLLLSIIEFEPDVGSFDKRRLVSAAVFAAIKDPALSQETLLEAIQEEEHRFRRTRRTGFVLATHLSVETPRGFTQARWDSSVLTFSDSLPPEFSYGELERTLKNLGLATPPRGWVAVRVRTTGRTAEEGAERALESLNSLRAVWSLWKSPPLYRMNSPVEKPVNAIRLGPVQTIHHSNGQIASRAFWYTEPFISTDYPGPPARWGAKEWRDCRQFEATVRRQLKKLPYREDFLALLREYVAILDSADVESNFLRLWTILEKLTSCGDGGSVNYDRLVDRASFIWQERETARLLLEHLRDVRNNVVHHLRSHEEASTCRYQVLRFVHSLLLFHLTWAGRFRSLSEMGQFLDLSRDSTVLQEQMESRRLAIKFTCDSPKAP